MMRLVFDLFPCQTESRRRGIGRYTQSLANSMARLRGQHDMYALANALYPESADALRQDVGSLLPRGHFSTYTHTTVRNFGVDSPSDTALATALIHRAYQALTPDVVLYSSPFEPEGVVAFPQGSLPSALRVAVLYDFIPWLFPAQYLSLAYQKKWYEQRLAALHKFDLLLAISEATRQDAIRILNFPPERIVNIAGAASEIFRPMPRAEGVDIGRFGIVRPFVLYTGNADYRKDQNGMLCAYAGLPLELRQSHQLVLNQVGDLHIFRRRMRALGLTDDEVVVTGHITDDDLISLYSQCKVFVFPSLYEGFGLPALEAMACGAPVIAANNSSIPEVMGRNDILFDAADTAATTAALHNVLTNDDLRNDLARYGIERAKAFSWEKTATLAWQAIETALAAKNAAPVQHRVPNTPKPRIAMVCPLPPQNTSATHHCDNLLPLLSFHFGIDLFVEEGTPVDAPSLQTVCTIYPHTQLAERRHLYATVIYQMANSDAHAYMLPLMTQFNGVIVLHDTMLNVPVQALAKRSGMASVLPEEILYCHGLQGLIPYLKSNEQQPLLPINRHVLESAERLVLLDPTHIDLLLKAYPNAWLPPMTLLPASEPACITAYQEVIHAAINGDQSHTINDLVDALENNTSDDNALKTIAAHAAGNWRLRKQPRLLVDVTQLAKTDARSGIQRVVRNIVRDITRLTGMDLPIELVRQSEGKLWRASKVIATIFDVPVGIVPEREVSIQPGDTLLMIDSSWEYYSGFSRIFQSIRQLGGKIITVVYDLIPLRIPETCSPGLVIVFNTWFRLAVEQSDMLLCISSSVAEDVKAYLVEHGVSLTRKLQIRHWPLGADIVINNNESLIRSQVIEITSDKHSPLFLMVGTVEPRKGHDFVLDAFDSLWQSGAEIRLCIAGTVGWMVTKTVNRILHHPQLNKKLFFIEKFTDAEINLCYASATALIAGSIKEGFGLPIVEASLHQVPVLASDIPVFREVGGDGPIYFSLSDSGDLVAKIIQLLEMNVSARKAMSSRVKVITWRESAERLLEIVLQQKSPYASTCAQSSPPCLSSPQAA
jgi:glycosyltransferase involved in cell wall biosynthesis